MTATVALTARGFSASRVKVRPGDTVTITLDPGRAVVQSDRLGRPLPWVEGDATGPLPHLLGGLRVLDRDGYSPEVLDRPGIGCVYRRLDWCDVEPVRGRYDWSSLDAIADDAIARGKHFSVGIRAGIQGTPRWALASVPTVRLPGLGAPIALPHTDEYRAAWLDVQAALAAYLRADGLRYLRCASVTASGCNWHTLEARLPNRAAGEDGAIEADSAVLARAGYTGVRPFFAAQFALLRDRLPGKDVCLPILSGGLPAIAGRTPLQQLGDVVADGRAALGDRLVVQHLGLADRPVNPQVLQAARDGSPIALQTTNDLGPGELVPALTRAVAAGARWVEVYPRNVPPQGLALEAARLGTAAPRSHAFRAPPGVSYVADASDPTRVLVVGAE